MKENNLRIFIILFKLFKKFKRKRKLQIFSLFFIILTSALFELITLSLAFPFLEIITNTENIGNIELFNAFFKNLGFSRNEDLFLPIVVLFASTVFLSAIIKNFNLWLGARLAASIGSDLSYECFKTNLYQDYEQFIKRNSSELITNNTVYINEVTDTLQLSARFFTAIIISIFISIYLLSFNFIFSLLAILVFSIAYFVIALFSKSRLRRNSQVIAVNTKNQVKLMQESNGLIKNIMLGGFQKRYLTEYKSLDFKRRIAEAQNLFINLFPRNTIESLLLIFVAIVSYLISKGSSSNLIIPTIGTFAIGAQKLLPYMQQTYGSWSSLVGSSESIIKVFQILQIPQNNYELKRKSKLIIFKNNLVVNNLAFRYQNTKRYIFKNTSFLINRGEIVGIYGATGSGKSSLIDILMGIIKPTKGYLEIDGIKIFDEENLKHLIDWRKQISHVPQMIYLLDSTIAKNIAFEDSNNAELKRVKEAARKANIDEYIESLPDGYLTRVGENGITLSGGQRQRIGLARALYKRSSVLVFDEATSALDINTENKILETIYGLKGSKTIFIISHRPNTLKKCDKLIKFSNGKVLISKN